MAAQLRSSKQFVFCSALLGGMMIWDAMTNEPPSAGIDKTKKIILLAETLKDSNLVGCDVLQRTYRFESCIFRLKSDVEKIDTILYSKGWRATGNKYYMKQKIAAWCGPEGTIYIGHDKEYWDVTFSNAPGNDQCR